MGSGGHSGGETPGPIPNPAAKPTSADGTAPARVWESRTPPDPNHRKGPPPPGALFPCPRLRAAPDLAQNAGRLRLGTLREHGHRHAAVVGPSAYRHRTVVRPGRSAFHRSAERAGCHRMHAGDRPLIVGDQAEGGVEG